MATRILTKKVVSVAGGAGLALAVLVGGYLIIEPTISKYNANAEELVQVQDFLDTMKLKEANLLKAKDDFAYVEQIDQELKIQFPQTAQTKEFIEMVTTGAITSGIPERNIQAIRFSPPNVFAPSATEGAAPADGTTTDGAAPAGEAPAPAPIVTSGQYATVEVSISVISEEQNLLAFLNYLKTMDRAFIAKGFAIGPDDQQYVPGGNGKSLSFTGTIFIYPAITPPTEVINAQNGGNSEQGEDQPSQPVPDPTNPATTPQNPQQQEDEEEDTTGGSGAGTDDNPDGEDIEGTPETPSTDEETG